MQSKQHNKQAAAWHSYFLQLLFNALRESHRRRTVAWHGGHSSAARTGESSSFSTSPLVVHTRTLLCVSVFVLAIYRTDIYRHRGDNNQDNKGFALTVAKERTRNAAVTQTKYSYEYNRNTRETKDAHSPSVYRTCCAFVVHTKVCK